MFLQIDIRKLYQHCWSWPDMEVGRFLFAVESRRKHFKSVGEPRGFTRIVDALLERIYLLGSMAKISKSPTWTTSSPNKKYMIIHGWLMLVLLKSGGANNAMGKSALPGVAWRSDACVWPERCGENPTLGHWDRIDWLQDVASIYLYTHVYIYIWVFPKIMVPPNHLF